MRHSIVGVPRSNQSYSVVNNVIQKVKQNGAHKPGEAVVIRMLQTIHSFMRKAVATTDSIVVVERKVPS